MFKKQKKKEQKRDVLKRAYALGFEVGYYKHYESVGWVKKEKRALEEKAREIGIVIEFSETYNRGKEDGERKKSTGMIEEKSELVENTRESAPIRGMEAISIPKREPKFFHVPKFLKRNQR